MDKTAKGSCHYLMHYLFYFQTINSLDNNKTRDNWLIYGVLTPDLTCMTPEINNDYHFSVQYLNQIVGAI